MILVLAFVRKAIRWAIAGAMPSLAAISLAAPAQAQPQNYYPGWAAPPGYYGPRPQRPIQPKRARETPATPATPADGTELLKRGDSFAERGDFDRATEQYDRAIKADAA